MSLFVSLKGQNRSLQLRRGKKKFHFLTACFLPMQAENKEERS
jgi:hypothetical protein